MSLELAQLQQKLAHALSNADGPKAKYDAYKEVMKDAMANGCQHTNVRQLQNGYSMISQGVSAGSGATMNQHRFPSPKPGPSAKLDEAPAYVPRMRAAPAA